MTSNARELAQIPSTPSGRRNLLINGAMQVAQRATSLTGQTSANAIFTVDRFNTEISGPTSFDIERVTDSPDEFSYSQKVTINGSFSASASQYIIPFEQRLEGQDLQQLLYGTSGAKSFTVSFYIKSTKTGTYVLQARHQSTAGQERTQAQSYTIDSANTWEKKTITFSGDTNDDIANDNAGRFTLFWWMIAGSTFTSGTLATSWEDSTNANRAVGVASSSADDDSWQITGVQMEIGSVATEFEHRTLTEELALCRRYFYKNTTNTIAFQYRGDFRLIQEIYPTEMRANPTVAVTAEVGTFQASSNASAQKISQFTAASSTSTTTHYVSAYTADAEL